MEKIELSDVLDTLCLREEATDAQDIDRLCNVLYEIDPEDVERFVQGSAIAAAGTAIVHDDDGGRVDPMLLVVSLLIIGAELGRELERRAR